jgi:trk system potassium uptake protein TrkA
MEAGDELLFITTTEQEDRLQELVAPGTQHHRSAEDDEV